MEEIDLDLSAYKMVFINPGIHVNTGWAFSQLQLSSKRRNNDNVKQAVSQPVVRWKDMLTNDFETPVFSAYPEIKEIKDELYRKGAVYASMSGTGSTVFGLYRESVPDFSFSTNCTVLKTT